MPADKTLLTPTLIAQFNNKQLPRGFRNNNPGNIDYHVANDWLGQFAPADIAAVDQTAQDPRFAQFQVAQYGIRAMLKIFRTYQSKYGAKTFTDLINRWAPPSENNTSAYCMAVSTACNGFPNSPIDLSGDPTTVLLPFLRAVIRHETGLAIAYDDQIILQAINLA